MRKTLVQRIGGAMLVVSFVLSSFFPPLPTQAVTDGDKFVRVANYYLLSGPALDRVLEPLAQFDLVILPAEAQVYNQKFFSEIKKRNPDILLLAYVPAVSWNNVSWSDPLHQKLRRGIDPSWWLKDGSGNQKSVWPNTSALNLNSGWVNYLATYVSDEILSTGYWDGVFYDEVQDSIDWIGGVDTDRNGADDDPRDANQRWEQGFANLFKTTRDRIGTAKLMIINGSSKSVFTPYVNGRMFETFPSTGNSGAQWSVSLKDYQRMQSKVGYHPTNVVNVNSENTGVSTHYQKVRFGLATTLLSDGYFSFDHGTQNHAQVWTYDEYQAFLGRPKTDAANNGNGVWERDFEKGKVVLNAAGTSQTVRLDGEYEKLHGVQDPAVNDGSIVSNVTLKGQDGIVLLRPIDRLQDAAFLNGSFVRVFNLKGETKRTGFFTYDSAYRGGSRVVYTDVTGDGMRDTVVADQTYVTVYGSDGVQLARFAPYGEKYKIGVNIAVGDTDRDGKKEIVTGTAKGGGPHVKVYRADGSGLVSEFFAYDAKFFGGVRVVLGDLDGDGADEIVAGAGSGGGPHVRVFRADGKLLNAGFFAYDQRFRGGVFVAAGDVDGDGVDEIVTGPGVGGGPHVKVFTKDGKLKAQFFTFDKKDNKGAEVVATDIDGDGIAEIIGLTTDVFTLSFD
jgi:hypothetical protein